MRRILAFGVVVLTSLLAQPGAFAAEGRVSELQAQPLDPQRVSKYTEARGATAPTLKSAKPHSARAANKTAALKSVRPSAPLQSAKISDFSFFDAGSTLLADRDGDGFHREFRVRFDADVVSGDAVVFARLYLRRVGDRDWVLYHETDDFQISGSNGDDDYFVTTTLDDGWPTGDYDVLIDLYESGFSGIVATIGPFDSDALGLLPLEEAGLDLPIELPGYTIRDVKTTLLIDDDRDGHFSKFRVEFDPDADFDGTFVYAEVWVRAQGGEWIQEHVSDDFLVDASGQEDVYSLTADWVSGYPTGFYDVQIDLRDADTGALVASAGSERPELSRIPLEDQGRDTFVSAPPANGGGGVVTSREHGGGAIGGWFAMALLMLLVWGRLRPAGSRQAYP
ncbi:MAG TPA: choice-of-anchor H family protein [Steroidobacteraceae bacterium]|nr:choice-of-anchor H family protein [Steroidobacteraceae bacterium]